MPVWICEACGVEHPETEHPPANCAICTDERQYVPRGGQRWTTLERLRGEGSRVLLGEEEPGLVGLTADPSVGIGQRSLLASTSKGSVLWDPIGYADDDAARAVLEHGPVHAIASSHPHMFGVHVEWSRLLGGVPVYVAAPDAGWVQRGDPCIRTWSGTLELAPELSLHMLGGHFPGSAVARWAPGAEGKGVLLTGDTIFPGPDGKTVSFLRSYPNRLPLSAAVVDRIATAAGRLQFDRLYGNFAHGMVEADAREIVRSSADRYMAWVRGDFDSLT